MRSPAATAFLDRIEVLVAEMLVDDGVRLPGARREALLRAARRPTVSSLPTPCSRRSTDLIDNDKSAGDPVDADDETMIAGLSSLPALGWQPGAAQADYPKPGATLRYVVPFPPGGLTDVMARLVGQQLAERWKVRS